MPFFWYSAIWHFVIKNYDIIGIKKKKIMDDKANLYLSHYIFSVNLGHFWDIFIKIINLIKLGGG